MTAFAEWGEAETEAARRLIALALEEDLGTRGDITTRTLVAPDERGRIRVVCRAAGVVAGLPVVPLVFERLAPTVRARLLKADGAAVVRGDVVAELEGPLIGLLEGERTVLNFLTHLGGIASLTRRFVEAIAETRARIHDTRKTHPGWRILEKYAVRAGGGTNHRLGLFDMVLVKDNHIAGYQQSHPTGTLADLVRHVREKLGTETRVQVEVDDLNQLRDVLRGGPEFVLLDNMTCDQLREAVSIRDTLAPSVQLEASGGVTLDTVRDIARTGVDRISCGALTHSAAALDIAFDWSANGD